MRAITTTILSLALLASVGFTGAAAAQGCVPFKDIDHCPVGGALLGMAPDGSGLEVSYLGQEGNDGVSSRFAGATQWDARIEFTNPSTEPSSVTLTARANGEATSRATVRPVEGGYLMQAAFTGASGASTYSALIYNDGVLQGAVGGIRSAGSGGQGAPSVAAPPAFQSTTAQVAVYVDGMYWGELDLDRNWWWWGFGFGIMSNGGCTWGIQMAAAREIALPDGNIVEGDEIRLIEEVRGGGHYPYVTFDSIQVTSSVESFKVTSEITAGGEGGE